MLPAAQYLLKLTIFIIFVAIVLNSLIKWAWSTHGIITKPLPSYNYIVVGGGTAGCVVARRLWERTNTSVLVIEPGTTSPWIGSIPLLAPALQRTTADWAFMTQPQKSAMHGLNNRQSAWPRGKVLGGSSSINYLLHMWGARSDYDNLWGSENSEWNFESVRSYFKKNENYLRTKGAYVSDKRGKAGPMPVIEFDDSTSPLVRAFMDGVYQEGIEIGDLNGDLEDGAMLSQFNTWHGWRVSAFDAYLEPIMERSKIHLLTSNLAIKILIENKKAVGVVAVNVYSGEIHKITANKEVIVCAGVIGSPQLLMISGIGPKLHLEKHNIPVISDLPGVGRNLRDHLNVPLYFHIDAPVTTTTAKVRSLSNVWRYITKGIGPLSYGGVESVLRLPTEKNNSKMFFMLFNLGSINEGLFTSISNFKKETFVETFPDAKNDSKEGFIILASCTQPISTGRITLSSANPIFDPPIIEPNYLSKIDDVRCLKQAVRMGEKLGTTEAMRDLGAKLHLPGYSSCLDYDQSLDDDGYLECWIRMSAITAFHPVGTCAMGSTNKTLSVVDHKLRVRGIKNLRVVDSSIFPFPVSGNPNAVVMMVAEKAIDFILERRKRSLKWNPAKH